MTPPGPDPARDEAAFEATWRSPSGFPGVISAVNNQPVGLRVMGVSLVFFAIAVGMAMLMRLQLAVPDNDLIGPAVYNQLFTMHGSTMMFLFIVPFLEGLAIYLLPLMIGSRDMAFPRLSAFGFWCYVFGGLLFFSGYAFRAVPDAGWFAYTPLAGPKFSGLGLDFWVVGLSLVEIAGIAAGIEIVVTILKLRAPGMAIHRMPLFAWAMLVAGLMILVAFTTLLVATTLLELDRAAGFRFFDTARGGSSLLWQHLFWFFGHPEVYIMFLPAAGAVSTMLPTFVRRAHAGYALVASAFVVIGFISFGLWAHHMFTTGLPELSLAFFTAASLFISLAAGTLVFAWIATVWGSRPVLRVPFLYLLAFVVLFVMGGMTGVMVSVVPFDWQVHDTYFIVAHFHYVLAGGVLFPILAGIGYWLPKVTGRLASERLGRWHFGLIFVGFNLTFFPMHQMGLLGLPRRVYTYPASLDLGGLNLISTGGAFVLLAGLGLFAFDVLRAAWRGAPAGPDPWGGGTLEWSVASPPPAYSFRKPPYVNSREPAWPPSETQARPLPEDERTARIRAAMDLAPATYRATLVTDAVGGEPQAVQPLPGPTYVPFFAALGCFVAAAGVTAKLPLAGLVGAVFAAGAVVAWLWPSKEASEAVRASRIEEASGLSAFPAGRHAVAWWGVVSLVAVLATAFGALAFTYFYLQLYAPAWPPAGVARPGLLLPALAAALTGASIAAQAATAWAFGQGREGVTRLALAATGALGVGAAGTLGAALVGLGVSPTAHAYGSAAHTLGWTGVALLLLGLALNGAAQVRLARQGPVGVVTLQLEIAALIWYAAGAIALAATAIVFASPYVL